MSKLKHDLLYLAYYGTRGRQVAKDIGSVSKWRCLCSVPQRAS